MITSIDHFVITVQSLDTTLGFYQDVLGMTPKREPGRPAALQFGSQKINVHEVDHTFEPKAHRPTPGGADFCLVTESPVGDILKQLQANSVVVELGPIERNGARGPMTSVYFRDPDMNLVEVSRYKTNE